MANFSPLTGHTPPIFLAYADVEAWVAAAVADIVAALRADLLWRDRARLIVSGGSTPAPVYRALAQESLAWNKVDVALADERWLSQTDPDSNTRLVRDSLLIDHAAAAHFHTMLTPGMDIDDAVTAANASAAPASVAVLGMGPDGHTASLFPNMPGLAQALASASDYVAVDADGCPGAGAWRRRISLTPTGLAKANLRLLLICGEQKRRLVQHALDGNDPQEFPVRIAWSLPGAPLRIHWCP